MNMSLFKILAKNFMYSVTFLLFLTLSGIKTPCMSLPTSHLHAWWQILQRLPLPRRQDVTGLWLRAGLTKTNFIFVPDSSDILMKALKPYYCCAAGVELVTEQQPLLTSLKHAPLLTLPPWAGVKNVIFHPLPSSPLPSYVYLSACLSLSFSASILHVCSYFLQKIIYFLKIVLSLYSDKSPNTLFSQTNISLPRAHLHFLIFSLLSALAIHDLLFSLK